MILPQQKLRGRSAAILVADNFQIHEAFYPYFRMIESGARVEFVGNRANQTYHDYQGEPLTSTLSIQDASDLKFDFIHIPGGFAPMKLRANPLMLEFAKQHFDAGRLLGAICHAGSFLVSMGVLPDRQATSFHTLKDDMINAGAHFIDEAPVVDGNLITARTPLDLPDFMEAVIRYLAEGSQAARGKPDPQPLEDKVIGILVTARYHVHQVWYAYYRLLAEGAKVLFIGERQHATYGSRISHLELKSHLSVNQALDKHFDVLIVPGDWAADRMRTRAGFLKLVRNQAKSGKVLASIAEGHSVLVSAEVIEGKQIAGLPEMECDVFNAGANLLTDPVVLDKNLITGRDTPELPEFMRWLIGAIRSGK